MATDILDREIKVGCYVVFYCRVYRVLEVYKSQVKMILVDKSDTTKPVKKYAGEVCVVPEDDVLVWKIKQGY